MAVETKKNNQSKTNQKENSNKITKNINKKTNKNTLKNNPNHNKNKQSISSSKKNSQTKNSSKKNSNSSSTTKKTTSYPKNNKVSSPNKKKKNNQSKPKTNELEIVKKSEEKKSTSIVKEIQLITLTTDINPQTSINEEKETNKDIVNEVKENKFNLSQTKNKSLSKFILLMIFFLIIIIFFIIYITIPKIKLSGSNYLEIPYQNSFIDPGYHATKLGKDITKKIQINSNLINHKVGKYQIIYQTKYLFLTIKKVRNIHIIDNTKPIINIDNPVKICPHEDLSHIKYEAIDEYDGLLNNKVKLLEHDNILDLSVEDNSHNKTNVSIPLLRIDDELPEINLKNGEVIYLNEGTPYQEPGYTANDNCDGDLTKQVSISGTVEKNPGTYYLTYTVKDSSNNETKITRTIIVSKKTLPNSGYINNGSIYLTFDDGPNENTTRYILDILKEENIKATFFVTGSGPDYLIQRIYNEGHTLALHTASHDYSYVYSSVDNYFSDLSRVSERVKNLTGYESKIIRFPGGSSNTVSRNYRYGIMTELTNQVLNRGYRYYDWNIDSDDAGHAYTSEEVYYNVINNLSPYRANMILMHDTKYQTKNALRDIIHYAKNNGYTFKKIEMDTYMIRHKVNN